MNEPAHDSSFIVHRSSFIGHVLVLRLSALGDVIHTIPAVLSLKDADVSWVVEAPYCELVDVVAGVEAIPVRLKQWARSPIASRAAMRDTIRAMRGADVSIDFQGLVKSAMLGVFAGAKERIGFDRNAIREKPALLFTNRKVAVDTTKHVVEQNLELVWSAATQVAAVPSGSTAATGVAALHTGNWAAFARDMPQHDVVILPGAGRRDKLWPAERWREVARRTGALVAWGPGEEQLAREISEKIAPPTNLRELAGLLKNARLVIGADTGPLHLAAALGTKVVGLYGPTNSQRNGPYGQLGRCIQAKSMAEISVEAVMNMVERVIAE
ncbi:MAG TPA: lipopolysaccharide heptosyltransferase I [Thermoanaerobaculia bacterium]|nr:lipopolysaccharide heptosyltransferase I [Thermoanaerobaculia bacterium]